MKFGVNPKNWAAYTVAFGLGIPLISFGQAAQITYTIDPARSTLVLSGTIGGQAFQSQTSGSLIASYAGTITAERDFGADTFQITGADVTAQNEGAYTPGLDGMNPPLADYGFSQGGGVQPAGYSTFAYGAVRNLSFTLASPLIATPSSFDASLIAGGINSGEMDYQVLDYIHSIFDGEFDANYPIVDSIEFAPGSASIVDIQGIETLDIPVDTNLTVNLDQPLVTLHLSGSVFATAPLPEPTLFALPILGLQMLRRRRDAH